MTEEQRYDIAAAIFAKADEGDRLYMFDEIEVDGVAYFVDLNSESAERFFIGKVNEEEGCDEELNLADELEIEGLIYDMRDERIRDGEEIRRTEHMLYAMR